MNQSRSLLQRLLKISCLVVCVLRLVTPSLATEIPRVLITSESEIDGNVLMHRSWHYEAACIYPDTVAIKASSQASASRVVLKVRGAPAARKGK